MKSVIRDGSSLGALPAFLALAVLLWILGIQELALKIVLGTILGFVIAVPLRLLFFKDRPRKKTYTNIWSKIDASSFPSLHAYRSSMLAVLFILYDPAFITVAVLYYAFIAWSRIYLQKHDWIDIAVGTAFGVCVGLLL